MSQEHQLETTTLGKSGIKITRMSIGLWAIGGSDWGSVQDNDSLEAIETALDSGVNFFDTADVYGSGHSEELLGKAMKGRRDKFIVGTKIGWQGFDNGTSAYGTVDKLIEGVESNLRRLNTDYVDLIQDHIDFPETNTDIFIEGFQKLKKDGKVRAYGLSSSNFEYIQEFNADDQMDALQIDYSILNRTPEAEIFPYCREHNIATIIRGPLAMGILTGKFDADSRFGEGDFRNRWINDPEEHKTYLDDLSKVEKLKAVAGEATLAQLALQFVLANPDVSTVIPGAKNARQANMNIDTAMLPPLTEEQKSAIDAIVPSGDGRKIWPA
jgi:aryl-alcohol dehydrogenase-like predicted oxidoreductase